jgi:hypothetical protein
MISNALLADDVIRDLRSDVAYLRFGDDRDEDRLFLTGIELLAIAATMAVAHFWKGVFEGAGKRVGERTADAGLDRINRTIDRLKHANFAKPKELSKTALAEQKELDQSVGEIVAAWSPDELRAQLNASAEEQVALIVGYLQDAGFPSEDAQRHAVRICERLRTRVENR